LNWFYVNYIREVLIKEMVEMDNLMRGSDKEFLWLNRMFFV